MTIIRQLLAVFIVIKVFYSTCSAVNRRGRPIFSRIRKLWSRGRFDFGTWLSRTPNFPPTPHRNYCFSRVSRVVWFTDIFSTYRLKFGIYYLNTVEKNRSILRRLLLTSLTLLIWNMKYITVLSLVIFHTAVLYIERCS